MKQKGRNVAASVQARLLQLSRNSKLSLQDLLERYCTERLLYRLANSPHRSRFILKGAMLLIDRRFRPSPPVRFSSGNRGFSGVKGSNLQRFLQQRGLSAHSLVIVRPLSGSTNTPDRTILVAMANETKRRYRLFRRNKADYFAGNGANGAAALKKFASSASAQRRAAFLAPDSLRWTLSVVSSWARVS